MEELNAVLRRKMSAAAVIIAVMVMLAPDTALAQQLYGKRLASRDGKWLLPVATLHLGSTEQDHINRGSVQAWDLIAPLGSPVFPITAGVVEYAGCDNRGGYGCWLYIRHEGGIHTIMGHCNQGSITVKNGQAVTQWDVVCTVGWTGMTSFGPHTHLEIHKAGGGRYNISDFWDINAMHYAKLSNAESNEVITDIGVIGQATEPVQDTPAPKYKTKSVTLLPVLLQMIQDMPTNTLGGAVLVLIAVFVMLGQYRKLVFAAVVCVVGVVSMFEVPVANIQAAGINTVDTSGATWDKAYAFAVRWEGKKCTNDGAYTMAGVTQGAYNAYRKRHGLPPADVCQNLTEAERKEIAYEDYWVKSGAGELAKVNPMLAIAHFDFSFNAGAEDGGPPKQILVQCGGESCTAAAYNEARAAWYKTRKTCHLYCGGWLRRVNDLAKITQ